MFAVSHTMKVSTNGQVSIPADVRARWNTRRVVVVDLGDRIVVRPHGSDDVGQLRGKYAGRGPTVDAARRTARLEDAAHERQRR